MLPFTEWKTRMETAAKAEGWGAEARVAQHASWLSLGVSKVSCH